MRSPDKTLLIRNLYDPLDRLIANELPNEPKHQRFYCKSRLVTEIQGAANYSIVQHDDQLLAQQQSEGGALDTTLLATDQQRSVLNTLKANQPQHSIAYTAYGHHAAASRLFSLLGFNGERPDPVTGWYLLGNGYRAFNPVLMRFTSPDSLSPFREGGINSYAYCLGDPINREDKTGRSPLLKSLMLYIESKAVATTKHILGPKATAQLAEWRAPAKNFINQSTNRDISSLKAVAINSLRPDEVLPHARTSSKLREILSTTDPYNFNRYQDLKHLEMGIWPPFHPQSTSFVIDNHIYKVQTPARFKHVKDEFSYIRSRLPGQPLTPSATKAVIKKTEDIRSNFSELPLSY